MDPGKTGIQLLPLFEACAACSKKNERESIDLVVRPYLKGVDIQGTTVLLRVVAVLPVLFVRDVEAWSA